MTAYLIVRAEVPEADREAFDRWYGDEHLPDAHQAFRSRSTWRGWSNEMPGLHVAVYAFPDLGHARAVVASENMKRLIAEFDRSWGDRVKRTREVFAAIQSL